MIMVVDLHVAVQIFSRLQLKSPKKLDSNAKLLAYFDLNVSSLQSLIIDITLWVGVFHKWLAIDYDAYVDEVLRRHLVCDTGTDVLLRQLLVIREVVGLCLKPSR